MRSMISRWVESSVRLLCSRRKLVNEPNGSLRFVECGDFVHRRQARLSVGMAASSSQQRKCILISFVYAMLFACTAPEMKISLESKHLLKCHDYSCAKCLCAMQIRKYLRKYVIGRGGNGNGTFVKRQTVSSSSIAAVKTKVYAICKHVLVQVLVVFYHLMSCASATLIELKLRKYLRKLIRDFIDGRAECLFMAAS